MTGKAIVVKTGMGSSAALTTALIAALLQYFDVISLPSSTTSIANSSTNQHPLTPPKTTLNTTSNSTSLQSTSNKEVYKGEEEYNVYQLKRDKTILHNLSQLSHAIAQGKIG